MLVDPARHPERALRATAMGLRKRPVLPPNIGFILPTTSIRYNEAAPRQASLPFSVFRIQQIRYDRN